MSISKAFGLVGLSLLAACGPDEGENHDQSTANDMSASVDEAAFTAPYAVLSHVTGDVGFSALMSAWKGQFANESDFYNAARSYFNCYAYAAGSTGSPYVENGYGQDVIVMSIPGALSGQTMTIFTAEDLDRAVVSDGFIAVDEDVGDLTSTDTLQRAGYKLVAAFIDSDIADGSGQSFHFSVRDDDGRWSHKNGGSPIMDTNHDGAPLKDPHIAPQDYLGADYDFVGYYWRPLAGLDVTAAMPPVGALYNDGRVVTMGAYDAATMRDDLWIGTRSDYLVTSLVIERATLRHDGAVYHLIINDDVQMDVPQNLIFPEYQDGTFEKTGNEKLEIFDYTGAIHEIVVNVDGADAHKVHAPHRDYNFTTPKF